MSLDGQYSFALGTQDSATWSPGAIGGTPSVTYSSGGKIAYVNLICSKDGTEDMQALGENPINTYKLALTSKCACWNGCGGRSQSKELHLYQISSK